MVFSFFRGNKPSLLQTGPGGQSRSHVLDRPEMSIGRASNADIVVDDPFLAPIHARIERQSDGGFIIRRMGLNPIMLRGEALLQTASLKAGDSFRLGKDVEFQFVVKAAAKEAPKKEASKAGDDKPKKSLLKQPAFLAGMGVAYLAIVGIIGYVILSDSGSAEGGPTAERINAEAARIPTCIKNARRMRQVSRPASTAPSAAVSAGMATQPMPPFRWQPSRQTTPRWPRQPNRSSRPTNARRSQPLPRKTAATIRWRRPSTSRPTISFPTSTARPRASHCSGGPR